ncbi:MAG: FAD-dependent oxidoreductase [Phycisphaerae bacterium]|nr:FAD-dependent oxidoreductase [Phycisphaerae bacterium]
MPAEEVIVVGGGVAGIACAVRLAAAGVRVRLIETRKKLGGRATSFRDVRSGMWLDNCQHVVLGCCTNYLDLMRRLGSIDLFRWSVEQHWVESGGRTSRIRPGLLPAPLHFAGSVLRAKFLSSRDVLALGRAARAIMCAERQTHESETFGTFLTRLGQSDDLVRRFWAPVVVSACNLAVERVSAAAAIQVFQEGFFAHPAAASIGLPTVPLMRLYDGAAELLASTGGCVELGCGVTRVGAGSVMTNDGREFRADRVVCALSVERAARAIEPGLFDADPRFAPLARFEFSPILGVHLSFDRPVLELPHVVLVDRPTQWLFRKSADGRDVHAVVSAADAWIELDEEEIARRVLQDIHACFPHKWGSEHPTCGSKSVNGPQLLAARAVKEKRATFALVPGVEAIRPAATGPSGLILAGDYCATGWPATMEGATRSGYRAAEAVLGVRAGGLAVADLSATWLARLIGLRTDRGSTPPIVDNLSLRVQER